jgi:hypothetical protein
MSGERVLRNRSKTIGALVLAVLFVLGAVAFIANSGKSGAAGDWVGAVAFLLAAAYCILVSRTRVVVTDGAPTFVVKNALKTHEIAWSDVEAFDTRRAFDSGNTSTWVVKVRLRGGPSVICVALGGSYRTSNALESELETMLAHRKAESPAATPPPAPGGAASRL